MNHKIIILFQIISILFGLSLMTGCTVAGMYANDMSNKHSGALIRGKETAPSNPSNCHEWCHNGWCSMHCDSVSSR